MDRPQVNFIAANCKWGDDQSFKNPHIIQTTTSMNMNFAQQQLLSLAKMMPQSPLSSRVNTLLHLQFPVQQAMADLDNPIKTLLKDVIDK